MPKIGLEIHGYIDTNEKLFCNCQSLHGSKHAKPNTNICPTCTGQPGSKPMAPNKKAVDKVIEACLILGCKISPQLVWQRKHYSWPDLPKGYQNTISGPHSIPVGVSGKFEGIGITEAHLEEDPAAWNPQTGEIDYNRSGSPLIEIVTEPDFTSSEQVIQWLKDLTATLGYIKAIDKNAGIKADVNISLPEKNKDAKRVEIKNINSLQNIQRAIEHEVERQKKEGTPKIQETRMFDEKTGKTKLMRTKEQAQDYRFISDPDLPVITLNKKRIENLKSKLPETPKEKLSKLIKKHKIDKKSAEVLTKKIDIVEFFEKVIEKVPSNLAVPWVTVELLRFLNYNKVDLDSPEINLNPEHFIELLKLIENKNITELKGKEILNKFFPKSFSPNDEAKKNAKISNNSEIEKLVDKVIKENSKAIQDFKSGKQESLNFLVGQVMKLSNKRADFAKTREIFVEKLS